MNQYTTKNVDEPLLPKVCTHYSSTTTASQSEQVANVTNLEPKKSFSWLGYVLCVFSGLCFIACNVCIKFASSDFPVSSWQILFVRCFVSKVCMIPVLCWTKESILGPPGDVKARLRMGAQAVISGCILLCYFEGIRRLPLGDFGAIAFSSPAFTMVLSIFMLRDHCGFYRCMIGIILTVGVVLISRPSALFPEDAPASDAEDDVTTVDNNATTTKSPQLELTTSVDILGIFFALAGSALSALVTIIARQVRHIHFSVQVFWFSLVGELISILGMFLIDTTPLFSTWTMSTWLLSAGQGVFGLVGTVLILLALHWISPTKNKVIRSFQVVASYIIQVEAFGTIPHVTDYVAAIMIVIAVLGITLEERIMRSAKQGNMCRYL